ncbi:universal stress protein [Gloeocapsa sp. PCC 73106]|uniref:universal stress protein n=1 Tax=Gloeocapsa sp. PCC 73106 TaxID=102232 RepID=UPI0002ACAF60|nr:universal stress protein [Gloeocapsa sp. PCC 73106]ELR99126.1 universal stress protein UspA-like protein [Gloeocapsa sp. PCC 73106]
MFNTILFPIDHSREAREAAKTVANLAKTYHSRLIILSVVEPVKEGEISSPSHEFMTSPTAVSQLLLEAQTLFEQQGIKAEVLEKQGVPSFTICDVADETDADLIIMGSRGLGLTEQGVSESVANRVINLSPCPVLIVP